MIPVINRSQLTAEGIIQIGMGFSTSKILLAAVKFELFTILAQRGKVSALEVKSQFNLNCSDRHVYDFLDVLTAFGFLQREGLLEEALYSNSLITDIFLDKNKPSYIGGVLEMANNRLYHFWADLENALLTGLPQNEIKDGADHPFEELYKTPDKLNEFINAMSSIQMGNFMAFAQKFDFSNYKTLTDAGGAGGLLSMAVAEFQPHMQCVSFDLSPVEPIAKRNINDCGLAERIKTVSGNFFKDALPPADVVVMANILHDWDEAKKLALMQKAFNALDSGGAFVAIGTIIDDDRRENTFGLLISLGMLIETGKGFNYTFSDFNKWAEIIGFKSTTVLPLTGPSSAAVAYK